MNDIKTLRDMKASTLNKLVDLLDVGSDWESLISSYPEFIDDRMENLIRNNSKPHNSPSRQVLESLRNNLLPIVNLYECFKRNNLERCSEIIEQEFPADANFVKKKRNVVNKPSLNEATTSSLLTKSSTHNSDNQENQENLFNKNIVLSDINKNQQQSQVISTINTNTNQQQQYYQAQIQQQQQARQQQLLQASNTLQALITIYEEILPVIYESKQTDSTSSIKSSSNFGYVGYDSNRSMKLYGKFEIVYIQERKLTFKKREFYDPYDYIRELKMIKHRHTNMYTAECILKNVNLTNRYYALYPYDDPVHTKLLSEHAFHNYNNLKPSQFNTLHQLIILRDIACGLTYLHEKNEFKKNIILHGNLQPDNILVVLQEDNIKAKIFDFAKTIEVNESENFDSKIREEFYNFGLIIMLVLTWKYIDKIECEKIHSRPHGDPNLFQYSLFKEFNIDKQPNSEQAGILLRMFFALTSPDYDILKGIKRSYDKINQLLEKLNLERTRTAVFT